MKTLNVDQSDWGCIKVTGEDRVRFVQGMCTSDIEKLPEGEFVRTSMLDVKGRVASVFEAVKRADQLLLLCEPGLAEGTLEVFDKYAIMDDVAFEIVAQPLHRVWGAPAEVWTAPPVFEPCPEPVASTDEVESRRIEAGVPRYGVDVSGRDFPFESRLRESIDYDKGCYLGQEPIARVNAQGKPKRELYGLRLEGDGPVEVGTAVSHLAKAKVGAVTSSVVSPDFGPIALAYLNCSVAEPGTPVDVGGRRAVATPLPFDTAAQDR